MRSEMYRQTTVNAILFDDFSKERQYRKLFKRIYKEIITSFDSRRKLRSTTIEKLKKILDDVLKYILRSAFDGVVALPKNVFLRAKAHGGSMRTVLNYQVIRSAFERLGILESLDVKTYKGGPCQHYRVILGDEMAILSEDGFIDKNTKKRSKRSMVREADTYTVELLGKDETVTGKQILDFVEKYEAKKREYSSNPYIQIFKDGCLYKGARLPHYVLGTAICSRHGYDVRRFIEAQYHYHYEWKGEEPTIQYITSLYSTWNCIGRYEDYCKHYKNEIDHFGPGDDNIMGVTEPRIIKSVGVYDRVMKGDKTNLPVVRVMEAKLRAQSDFYSIKDGFNLSTRTIMIHYGHPMKRELSLHWLMEQPAWLELLDKKFWGDEVDKQFWEYLDKVDMNYVL